MKRLLVFTLLALSLSACAGASSQDGQTCRGGICIRVQLTEPIHLNKAVTATITVQTEQKVPELTIYLPATSPVIQVEGDRQWTIDAQAQQSITTNRVIRFTEEGFFYIVAQAHDRRTGAIVTSLATVHVTRDGGKVYYSGTPIPLGTPGEPIPAVTITPGPSPTRIRQTTPTRPPYP